MTPQGCDPPLSQVVQEKATLVSVTSEARLLLRESSERRARQHQSTAKGWQCFAMAWSQHARKGR